MDNGSIIKFVPNGLTILRLMLIPVFVVLMREPTQSMVYWATGLFIFASFTDFIDGYIARKFGSVSDLGKLLDPLADKILVMAALVMLVAQKTDEFGEPWVQGWMVVFILAREIWVTGLRAVAAKDGVVVAASNAGKIKSALQMFAIVLLLLHGVFFFYVGGYRIYLHEIGSVLLLFSIMISYWGAFEYTHKILKI